MTAERYGTQVILLLHRVALAVETDVLDTSAGDHRLRARSGIIEAVAVVVRAEVDPSVVGLFTEFVLQFDMIKVLIVHVVSVDHYRQIITRGVLRREGVHRPFVMRCGDIHIATYRHVMHAERTLRFIETITRRSQLQ